jgi:hypothetical protein
VLRRFADVLRPKREARRKRRRLTEQDVERARDKQRPAAEAHYHDSGFGPP